MSAVSRGLALGGCAVLAASLVVQAAPGDGERGGDGSAPEILGANVEPCPDEPGTACLHLTGTRLHLGEDPVVQLSGAALAIHLLQGRGTDVFAALPEDLAPRTHLIELRNPSGSAALESPLPGTGAATVPGYDVGTGVAGLQDGSGGEGSVACGEGFVGDGVIVGGGYRIVGAQQTDTSGRQSSPIHDGNAYGWSAGIVDVRGSGAIVINAICIDPSAFGQ